MKRVLRMSYCLVAVLVVTTVQAKTFSVEVGESIQLAVDAAEATSGPDTVKVAAGDFTENIVIDDDDALTLTGAGPGVTVISGGGNHVIKIESGDVTVRRLTVAGGKDGVHATGNSLTMHDVDASENDSDGVSVDDIGSVWVVGGTFMDNIDGDGIKVENADSIDIVGGEFSGQLDGDGLDFENVGSIRLRQVTANGNEDEGLEIDDASLLDIVGGEFLNNGDDGVDADDTAYIAITNTESSGNGFLNNGRGFQVEAQESETASVVIVNSLFLGNAEDGVKIVNDGSAVQQVGLTNVIASDNGERGLDIEANEVTLRRVLSGLEQGNGLADVLP